jgi:hypothetical protein
MLAKGSWLNREKLAFLASAAALAGAVVYAIYSHPEVRDPGEHRVSRTAPPELNVGLDQLARTEGIDQFLAGARPNPFTYYTDSFVSRPPPDVPRRTTMPPPPPPPPPPPAKPPPVTQPKPYQVPVDFRGILATETGEMNVLLKIKQTGENRRLVEGDIWPETGLRIVKITQSSVLLENDKGERFLMRDLYGRKTAPGGGN